KGGSYISVTLTWDRQVTLNDKIRDGVRNGKFDPDETFNVAALTDLQLLLVPKGGGFTDQIWASKSNVQNVEHLFYQLPPGDAEYEFWVRNFSAAGFGAPPAPSIDYAVAWWAMPAPDDT